MQSKDFTNRTFKLTTVMTTIRNLASKLALLLLVLTAASAYADEDPLKPEVAFQYVAVDAGDVIEIDWALEDGYYLYKKKLSFSSNTPSVVFGDYALPTGLDHEDEYFGKQQVYRKRFFVTIPYSIAGERPDAFEIQIKSQGCADLGLCYPPQIWKENIRLINASAPAGKAAVENKFGLASGRSALGDFLAVDDAFKPYAEAIDGNNIEFSFQIADGYYLYKDKISASSNSSDIQLGKVGLPKGKLKFDENFGESEVYFHEVFGQVAVARATPEQLSVAVDLTYQGCAEDGICYAPTTRTIQILLPQATAVSALPAPRDSSAPVSEQDRLASLISNSSIWIVIATFFGAGLLLALTPCVLPMVPILSGIIAGEGDDVSSARGFALALSYVMGMALVYTGAGIAAAAVGVQLQAIFNQPWVLSIFAGLFVILALGMFGLFELQMPSAIQSRLAAVSGRQKSGTVIGAFVMGALSSLIVTACVAPPLVATLTVIGQTGDMLKGGTALFALSLGMGAPLLLVGASAGKLLPKAGPWMVAIKNAFGFMMLGLAIWMLSRILPGSITLAMWGVLIFMAGVFMGGLTTLTSDSSGRQKIGKGFGFLAIGYGVLLLFGSLTGGSNPLKPLASISIAGGSISQQQHRGLDFNRIKTVADLDSALAAAAADGKTAMLDFYADWCVSCIEMEEYTFTDGAVQAALANTVLLQADVTANDEEDQALLQRFGVFGPPTIIFFGADGMQRNGYEVVGYMKAAEFTEHVNRAVARSESVTARNTGTH